MKVRKIQKNRLKSEVKNLRNKRLITITAMSEGKEYVVLYQFDDKELFILELRFPKKENHVDSIIDIFPGANIMEQELHDLFGIEFKGNPNMDHKLFLAEDWEEGPPRRDT
ncbi:MAG: NADH-quinone oxidoreductase subunit C [Nanoarchaeota archaeon]|nr:NADH-quinone oxidoreductase subunit C [Nanoarchaeota archaeon]